MAEDKPDSDGLTLGQVAWSVAAAFFGVQKDSVRRRDLSRGRPHQFILVGLAATALLVLVIVGVVSLVLRAAGV